MQESKIILTPIPQSNGVIKNRPALILRKMPKYQDLLVCGISTQLKQFSDFFSNYVVGAKRPQHNCLFFVLFFEHFGIFLIRQILLGSISKIILIDRLLFHRKSLGKI